MNRKVLMIFFGLLLTITLVFAGTAISADGPTVESLEKLIKDQQQQFDSLIKAQQQQMKALQTQLEQLKQTASDAQTQAKEAKSVAEEAKTTAQVPIEKRVTSGQERIKLEISGQVNRAVNVADDGKKTKAYFVDSDASNSRLRFVGTAKATDDLTLGSRLEIAIAPNESSDVSQVNEESGDFSDQRWAEVSLASKRFGKVSLGKGDTASNNTAEVDLSKVDVVAYASVADMAGGLLFRTKSGDALTDISIADAFKNQDGLSRKSRLRYDTPTFQGFRLAGSLVSDQRYDGSLWWGGEGYGFKAAAAVGIADPNEPQTGGQYSGSFSFLHEATGLNLTLSAGLKDRDNVDDPTNYYIKPGWIAHFFSVGDTAFAVDYTRSVNLPTEDDDGYSFGLAAVQQFEDYGTELYAQYRLYSLDVGGASVNDINVGTVGARVKF